MTVGRAKRPAFGVVAQGERVFGKDCYGLTPLV